MLPNKTLRRDGGKWVGIRLKVSGDMSKNFLVKLNETVERSEKSRWKEKFKNIELKTLFGINCANVFFVNIAIHLAP